MSCNADTGTCNNFDLAPSRANQSKLETRATSDVIRMRMSRVVGNTIIESVEPDLESRPFAGSQVTLTPRYSTSFARGNGRSLSFFFDSSLCDDESNRRCRPQSKERRTTSAQGYECPKTTLMHIPQGHQSMAS